jgi:hypothetical protein
MLLYTCNLIPKIPARILGKHCQIMFLRTFGSRRPPTAGRCRRFNLLSSSLLSVPSPQLSLIPFHVPDPIHCLLSVPSMWWFMTPTEYPSHWTFTKLLQEGPWSSSISGRGRVMDPLRCPHAFEGNVR